ncbi:hypothetical protein L596_011618 [Steinernema carpocapsae]|uniref:Uncharacterized protein n=1 Tax=Steinernema carpocapsae TaxID=34508 RepID=A0A4U5NVE1_STECR|nr:hypothetical protein L596_011618 [Steinernema carpocapsae]
MKFYPRILDHLRPRIRVSECFIYNNNAGETKIGGTKVGHVFSSYPKNVRFVKETRKNGPRIGGRSIQIRRSGGRGSVIGL